MVRSLRPAPPLQAALTAVTKQSAVGFEIRFQSASTAFRCVGLKTCVLLNPMSPLGDTASRLAADPAEAEDVERVQRRSGADPRLRSGGQSGANQVLKSASSEGLRAKLQAAKKKASRQQA